MAKSLRSKQKRKMRAIKRVRYGEKEMKRLVEMVKKAEANEKSIQKNDINEITKHMDIDENPENFISISSSTQRMETDQQNERNRKTMLDQFGQYPEWMSGRRLKKQKSVVRRLRNKRRHKK